jgi:ubiquinone/menaquinone biosynthesis C-methylase UbiE
MESNFFTSKARMIDGIYSFIDEKQLVGDNKKYNQLYNKIAWLYHLSGAIFYQLKFGGEKKFRNEFLKELIINAGEKVLETSAGTGDNFRFLNKGAKYFAVDISLNMLKKAKSHSTRWGLETIPVHCEAEVLPFPDDFFDVVYHCGGINFYNDKGKAIKEMIRVAKPGTTLLIVDETEKTVQKIYAKNGVTKGLFEAGKASIPTDLIPREMLNIRSEIVCKGYMYKLMFQKPQREQR